MALQEMVRLLGEIYFILGAFLVLLTLMFVFQLIGLAQDFRKPKRKSIKDKKTGEEREVTRPTW